MLKMLSCVNDFFRVCFSCTFESLKLINPLYTTIIMKTSKLTIRKSTITKFENKYTANKETKSSLSTSWWI